MRLEWPADQPEPSTSIGKGGDAMQKLVRLWRRPSRDGNYFTYVLIFKNEQGKLKYESLGHTDSRKAKRQRDQKERELRMGFVELGSMKLREFLEDCLTRTRGQVRGSTLAEYGTAMRHFIDVIGNIDFQQVGHVHGERFIQARLDLGDTPATARKKIKVLKRIFQLAVDRGQLEENPLRRVRQPKVPRNKVRVYGEDECTRLIKTTRENLKRNSVNWELLIHTALCTGMRRGELLNTTWRDIDFERQVIHVSPKRNTAYTWEWHIKDTDRRSLPLTDELVQLLAQHQVEQPEGYPYVFVPTVRFERIQERRRQGKWTVEHGRCPLNNFSLQFRNIRMKAGLEDGTFHDLRRTCLTGWFSHGLSEYDVMKMAGHANFETTRTFYLAVRSDLLDRTRAASTAALAPIFVARALRAPSGAENEERPPIIND